MVVVVVVVVLFVLLLSYCSFTWRKQTKWMIPWPGFDL